MNRQVYVYLCMYNHSPHNFYTFNCHEECLPMPRTCPMSLLLGITFAIAVLFKQNSINPNRRLKIEYYLNELYSSPFL